MKPVAFAYHRPASVDEAVAMLNRFAQEDGRVLAGGQSLVPIMAFRLSRPAHLVDINPVTELNRLDQLPNALRIGALVRHVHFHRPVTKGPLGRLLSRAVRHIAHYPIRVRGTFCGSLAHADPASEWCCVTAALGGRMRALSLRGVREIPASDYFMGVMTTALMPDELLTDVQLPLLQADTRVGFEEFSRRAGDFAMAMSVVTYRIRDGGIVDATIGIGGAEAVPRRIGAAEAVLHGRTPGPAVFRQAAEVAADAIEPLEDSQTDAAYRRDLARALVRRALERAA
jgi:aerobic carbon-monoxide dehydrogenase medium subunit